MKMSVSLLLVLVSLTMVTVYGNDTITVTLVNSTGLENKQGIMSCPCTLNISMTLSDSGQCMNQTNSKSAQCSVDVITSTTLNIDNGAVCHITNKFPGKPILHLGVDVSEKKNKAVILPNGFRKTFCQRIDTNIRHQFYYAKGGGNTSLLLEVITLAPSTTTTLTTPLANNNPPGITLTNTNISPPVSIGTTKKDNEDGSLSGVATAGIVIGVIVGVGVVILVCLGFFGKLPCKKR